MPNKKKMPEKWLGEIFAFDTYGFSVNLFNLCSNKCSFNDNYNNNNKQAAKTKLSKKSGKVMQRGHITNTAATAAVASDDFVKKISVRVSI